MLAIVIPIYNDWSSFTMLVSALHDASCTYSQPITILAIDDGSTLPPAGISLPSPSRIQAIELIALKCNLGHQRAIAIGLSKCLSRENLTAVLVMDSDGEDSPTYINAMLHTLNQNPTSIVVASRAKRSEKLLFRAGYTVYKRVFQLLTGEFIDFGNFCLLPIGAVRRIAFMPDLWNHFAATIVKSGVPLQRIPTERANRYSGSSSMNLVGLVIHGFSAISVFSDRVLTRLLLFIGATLLLASGLGTTAFLLRMFSELAIPGWATNVLGFSGLLFFQSLTILVVIIFTNLSNRTSVPFIPGSHSTLFIDRTTPFPANAEL